MPSANINANYIGGGGRFLPSKVSGLTLWLDDPGGILDGINNVLEDGSNDVSAWLDRSLNYVSVTTKIYDWSGADDDFSNSTRLTGVGNIDGISDGTISKDNCLRGTLTDGSVTHFFRDVGIMAVGKVYRFSGSFFVPSAQTLDGFRIAGHQITNIMGDFQGINGAWTDFNFISEQTGNGNNFNLVPLDGSSTTVNGDGDVFYVQGLVIEDITGNHFVQSTAADQPNRSGSEITFDGVSEFLDGSLSIANFNDSSGELFMVLNDLAGVGINNLAFGLSEVGTDANHIFFGIAEDKYDISYREASVLNNIEFGAAIRSTTQLYAFSSSGTAYKLEVNGGNKSVSSGTDDGDWVADNGNLDSLSLGALIRTTSIFYNTGLKSVLYYNRQLTAPERASVTNYLNGKFGVF